MNVSDGAHRRANARRARRHQVLPPTELRAPPARNPNPKPASVRPNASSCARGHHALAHRRHPLPRPFLLGPSPAAAVSDDQTAPSCPVARDRGDSSGPHVLRKQAHPDRGAASLTLSRGLLLLLGLDREGPRRGAPCESGGRDGQHTAGTKAMMGGAPPSERC